MAIGYDEVKEYRDDKFDDMKRGLQAIEGRLLNVRKMSESSIPIYAIRWRVKDVDSIYLKIKRKNYHSLKQIKDFAGLRVLCLYEQDILSIHKHILSVLRDMSYSINKSKIYSVKQKEVLIKSIKNETNKISGMPLSDIEVHCDRGYSSIHYVYKSSKNLPFVEIQLRTLLQDVWGQLEHSLAYKKGNIHPHITKSFGLLAQNLNTNDELITHLKTVADKEAMGKEYELKRAWPVGFFDYEKDFISKHFKPGGKAYDAFTQYIDWIKPKGHELPGNKDLIGEGRDLLERVLDTISNAEAKKDKKFEYFSNMEEAYFLFCEGKYDRAYEQYMSLKEKSSLYDKCYVPYFRMGEILLIKGETAKALDRFDQADQVQKTQKNADPINLFRIKTQLAYAYWLLGNEYSDHSIDKIQEAYKIYEEQLDKTNLRLKFSIINNLSAYYLEGYIIACNDPSSEAKAKAKQRLSEARKWLRKLEALIKNSDANAHMFDTVAWFYFKLYLQDEKEEHLTKAREYADQIIDKKRLASLSFLSANIHLNHIQEIMLAWKNTEGPNGPS